MKPMMPARLAPAKMGPDEDRAPGRAQWTSGVMAAVPSSGSRPSEGPGRRSIALVVDDDPSSLRNFHRVLARKSVDILTATTPSEAIGLVTMLEPTPQPIIAFLDVLMPAMDGPRFVHALRSFPAFGMAPVVLVSGLSAPALEKATLEWGAHGFIQKTRGLLHVEREFSAWLERVSVD